MMKTLRNEENSLEEVAALAEESNGLPSSTVASPLTPLSHSEILEGVMDIDLVVNLKLREEALLAKCLGRRICSECGGNYNVACIDIKGGDGSPELYMAPLLPPPHCASKLITRSDDTEEVVKERLRVYNEMSRPVEEFYRSRGKLLEFDLPGGIPESWPKLLQALNLDNHEYTTNVVHCRRSKGNVVPQINKGNSCDSLTPQRQRGSQGSSRPENPNAPAEAPPPQEAMPVGSEKQQGNKEQEDSVGGNGGGGRAAAEDGGTRSVAAAKFLEVERRFATELFSATTRLKARSVN
ncbi:hypothetical protein LOK49_LG07G01185 [Camellia lanceoleosa]|uniref:Uncharacterized protein n=1 Tax=Camellia lanceoleosa TaxID=1840588 RepID=A0ACC0H1V8_9ERIC|nr:hypothetical protein LOK49_LG07G01185 [Camellia lanceoleosa]